MKETVSTLINFLQLYDLTVSARRLVIDNEFLYGLRITCVLLRSTISIAQTPESPDERPS